MAMKIGKMKRVLAGAMAVLVLAGCSKDDDGPGGKQVDVQLSVPGSLTGVTFRGGAP